VRPLLFLDVDGTLIPLGGKAFGGDDGNPLLARLDPARHHAGPALPHRVDQRFGLTEADFAIIDRWLRRL
jgi:hypothetical protein